MRFEDSRLFRSGKGNLIPISPEMGLENIAAGTGESAASIQAQTFVYVHQRERENSDDRSLRAIHIPPWEQSLKDLSAVSSLIFHVTSLAVRVDKGKISNQPATVWSHIFQEAKFRASFLTWPVFSGLSDVGVFHVDSEGMIWSE